MPTSKKAHSMMRTLCYAKDVAFFLLVYNVNNVTMATTKTPQPVEKTFKLSQLEEIENLDDKDLFLVSDYEGGKCYTKKLTMKKLLTVIANNPELIQFILDQQGELDEQIQNKVNDKVEEAFDIQTIDGGTAHGA